jgi:alkylated DNA repair protein alkB family protein 1
LLEGLFPGTKAEAAIVNLYSPGDTLSVHRDVAEECGKGLISVSLGCDAIFVIGTSPLNSEPSDYGGQGGEYQIAEKILTLRLRSGSAVYMSGESRFAWHGVPQIVRDTCPEYLKEWPAGGPDGKYEDWRGWMSGKRVNLNVRQMWES